jgi:hypothetical protein
MAFLIFKEKAFQTVENKTKKCRKEDYCNT